ncbi:hypothetical protein D9M73_214480 [compost metagenome]
MEHVRTQVDGDLRQGFRQQLVQRFCAQASAQDQQTRLATGQGRARCFQEQLGAHRVTGGPSAARQGKGVGERFTDSGGQRHQQPIGGTGHGVLFVNDHRHTGQFGRDAARTGHKPTKANDADRLQTANDRPRLPDRLEQHERCL